MMHLSDAAEDPTGGWLLSSAARQPHAVLWLSDMICCKCRMEFAKLIEHLNSEVNAITSKLGAADVAHQQPAAAAKHAARALADAPEDRTLEQLHDTAQREVPQSLKHYLKLENTRKELLRDRRLLIAKTPGPG